MTGIKVWTTDSNGLGEKDVWLAIVWRNIIQIDDKDGIVFVRNWLQVGTRTIIKATSGINVMGRILAGIGVPTRTNIDNIYVDGLMAFRPILRTNVGMGIKALFWRVKVVKEETSIPVTNIPLDNSIHIF